MPRGAQPISVGRTIVLTVPKKRGNPLVVPLTVEEATAIRDALNVELGTTKK